MKNKTKAPWSVQPKLLEVILDLIDNGVANKILRRHSR